MYFRRNEVVNDVFSHANGNLALPMSNDFMVKGTAIESKKEAQELSHWKANKKAVKGREISLRPTEKKLSEEVVVSKPFSPGLRVEIVNRTERQQEGNNNRTNITTDSSLQSSTEICSRELRRAQYGLRLLRNKKESVLYNLLAKYKDEADCRAESEDLCIKRIEYPEQRKCVASLRRQPSKDILTLPQNHEMLKTEKCQQIEDRHLWKGEACEQNANLARACSARTRDKAIEIKGKRYSTGSAGKIKALHCALSRRSHSVDQAMEDEDYQRIDYEYLLKFKTVSRLSRMCDNSVIDAVAKENSARSIEAISLPPVFGSKWKLKDRYASGLSFNPTTPVLREYTRISQARVVDFSNSALGSQVL